MNIVGTALASLIVFGPWVWVLYELAVNAPRSMFVIAAVCVCVALSAFGDMKRRDQ